MSKKHKLKYEVKATRLIEQECKFFVDAVDESAAREEAKNLIESGEIADMIWDYSDLEHTPTVEEVKRCD